MALNFNEREMCMGCLMTPRGTKYPTVPSRQLQGTNVAPAGNCHCGIRTKKGSKREEKATGTAVGNWSK